MIYRSKFIISFIHVFLIFSLSVFISDGLNVDIEAFIFAFIYITIATYICIRYFKITITDEYLRGYDFWGKYHSVEWNNIISIKPIRIAGLKYVRVESKTLRRPLWVPLFLNDMCSFKAEVNKRLADGNPLKTFLDDTVKEIKKNT